MVVFLTVVSGVLVYVLGQMVGRFLLDPLYEQRVVIRTVHECLVLYADIIHNPGIAKMELMDEASRAARSSASNLRSRTDAIPSYTLLARLRLVRSKDDIRKASKALIGISNSVHLIDTTQDNAQRAKEVRDALRLSL